MSALHDLLWTLCRKLPSDFTPYGKRDCDAAEPCADCSCGCRHFLPLAGESGNDWGVCANPKSPRAGLLTFEHQGCPQFEADEESATPDALEIPRYIPGAAAAANHPETNLPAASLKKLKIDFEELVLALEGFPSPDIENYLDTETGEIIPLHEDFDDAAKIRERIDAGLGDRYLAIETLESHESFRIMEDFAATLAESQLRARLLDALTRNKPFARFKELVHADLALRDQWFAFRDDAQARYARDWLEAHGIEAELERPRK